MAATIVLAAGVGWKFFVSDNFNRATVIAENKYAVTKKPEWVSFTASAKNLHCIA